MNSRRQALIRSNISERGEATKLKVMCWARLGWAIKERENNTGWKEECGTKEESVQRK